jgi:lactoylglutathione lyase
MSELQFRNSGFFVEDVVGTVDFYTRAFSFRMRYLHPSQGYAELDTGNTLLSFIGEAFLAETDLLGGAPILCARPDQPIIGAQIALVTEDLDRDWQRAIAAGATILKLPEAKPWGQIAGYLRDPNGIVVELCTPSPRA